MKWRELSIEGAWEITPRRLQDSRGIFLELFKESEIEAASGRRLPIAQANLSTSAAGVVRGVHFSDTPPGQAKYVTCPRGAVLDVVVDVRIGSPTYGKWDAVVLDETERRAAFITEGLGHAFCALREDSTVVYLCSSPYAPERERGLDPFDPEIGIEWPAYGEGGAPLALRVSEKDRHAPRLHEAAERGLLPSYDVVTKYLESLAMTAD